MEFNFEKLEVPMSYCNENLHGEQTLFSEQIVFHTLHRNITHSDIMSNNCKTTEKKEKLKSEVNKNIFKMNLLLKQK